MQWNWRKTDNLASWKLPASHNPANTAHSQPFSCGKNPSCSWEPVPITTVPKVGFLTLKFSKRLLEICELPELEMYVHVSGERMRSFQQIFKDAHDPQNISIKYYLFIPLDFILPVTMLQVHHLSCLSASGQCVSTSSLCTFYILYPEYSPLPLPDSLTLPLDVGFSITLTMHSSRLLPLKLSFQGTHNHL